LARDGTACQELFERYGEILRRHLGRLLRSFFPLDRLLRDFHQRRGSQYLQLTNWIDMHTHMRRWACSLR